MVYRMKNFTWIFCVLCLVGCSESVDVKLKLIASCDDQSVLTMENCSTIREGDFKLIDYYDKKEMELYDLKNDPYETTNLVEERPDLAKQLHAKLIKWKEEVNAVHKKVE